MGAAESLSRLRNLGFQEVTAPALSFEQARIEPSLFLVIGTRGAMSTRVSVQAISSSAAHGEAAIVAAFAELDRLVGIFSRHQPDSALSALNQAGHLAGAPPELVLVLQRSRYFHALSRGAFDVTVKPVLDLLDARFPGREPSPGELKDAAALVGAEHLTVQRGAIRFARAGMSATTDGIAKGYIVDRMADVLAASGVERFLIDAGGDIRSRGLNPEGRPWRVGVRGPGDTIFPDAIGLRGGSVATSGSYERFYDPKHRFHHIVDPGSGLSPGTAWSVSVAAPTALAADALATTVFVLGPDAGMRLLESLPECAGFVVTAGGETRPSSRWSSLTHSQKEYLA